MEKEDFINKVLNSMEGITKVTPNDAIFQKIEKRIEETKISKKTLWFVASSIVVLVFINIILISGKSKTNNSEMASLENSINKSNQLYK